jgi:hypothetical protein
MPGFALASYSSFRAASPAWKAEEPGSALRQRSTSCTRLRRGSERMRRGRNEGVERDEIENSVIEW